MRNQNQMKTTVMSRRNDEAPQQQKEKKPGQEPKFFSARGSYARR